MSTLHCEIYVIQYRFIFLSFHSSLTLPIAISRCII